MTDKELVLGILADDEKSLQCFYQNYSPILTSFIRKKISDEKDVEEIFQDTMFAFLEALRDFTFKCSLSTYLISIGKRKIVDFYRKKKIKKVLFSQMPESLTPLLAALTTPETSFDEKLLKQSIEKTLTMLKPKYRQIIHLKYVEGFSVSEIAQKLSLSFKTAESRLFRARSEFIKLYSLESITQPVIVSLRGA